MSDPHTIDFVPGNAATAGDDLEEILRTESYRLATASTAPPAAEEPSPAAAAPVSNGAPAPTNGAAAPPVKKPPASKAAKKAPKSKGKKSAEEMGDLTKEVDLDDHTLTIPELEARYKSSAEKGLRADQIDALREEFGMNELTPPYQTPEWVKFMRNMFSGFASLLWVGSILCFIAYGIQVSDDDAEADNLYLGIVLAAVVIITGIFSYFQEAKSSAVMRKFAKLVPQMCTVIRDGNIITDFPARELVPGDVIEVKYGDIVPADIRILSASNMKVDNSSLTGESEPQKRDPVQNHDRPLETQNIAFFTTHVQTGSGRGMVIQTGDNTVIGRIKLLVESTGNMQTPIAIEIEHFIHLITTVAVTLGVIFFALAFVIGYNWLDAVIFLIGIIVANVPEGLLATVTVSLTLTAKRMATKNVLVKNLESVETLGSTSCICSDKTGTLTQNRMTVAHVWYDGKVWQLGIMGEDSKQADKDAEAFPMYQPSDPSFRDLWTVGQLNSNSVFVYDTLSTRDMPHQERKVKGDASEAAILKFVDGTAVKFPGEHDGYYKESEAFRPLNEKVLNVPFNSKDKFAASVHKTQDGREGDALLLVLKGAPERVIGKCSHIMINGQREELTAERRAEFEHGYETLGGMGERVLGFSHKYLDPSRFPKDHQFSQEEPYDGVTEMSDLTFVGLMALIDPPRVQVPNAIHDCQTASVRVIMVTGDHPITAKAIARGVGIISEDTAEDLFKQKQTAGEYPADAKFESLPAAEQLALHGQVKAQVVTGQQLKDLDEDALDAVLDHEQVVFARTSPQQKLQIVQGCQRKGWVVAVTGDGVNDSPALKAANIGVAMGIAGSDVSKEAADMILLDDDFSSIVKGVEEGRLIFDNLKKSIAYTLTSNIPEISPFLIFIIVQVPLPLSTIMILAIDLGTDMYPAISLAYELPENDIMLRAPRNAQTDKLVNSRLLAYTYLQIGVIQALAGFFCYFVVMGDYGFLPGRLVGLREDWDDEDIEDLRDSYGQEWGYDERKTIEKSAQTSYFVSIVIVQWADILICKTRVLSLFQQGLRNYNLNCALVFETLLAVVLTYVPGTDAAFNTEPLRWPHFGFPAIGFSILIFVYDEIRKYIIRRDRRVLGRPGWVERETYY
eukprot:m.479568 g.479568  ORF g.479568 m.479568 type:complete len:1130 (-) comp21507_c0_seq1:294-3683(-)